MSKYIDADKAIKDYAHYGIEHSYDATDLEAILNECPTADVAEVRHGRWIEQEADMDTIYECSVCGEPFVTIEGTPADNLWNYCPNCGASMRGEEK